MSGARLLFSFLVLALTPGLAPAETRTPPESARPPLTAETRLPSRGLRDDAAILRDAFETLHPGLRRYLTPAKLDAAFAALDEEFAQDRTLGDAFHALSVLTAKVRCGHTWPSFHNQSDGVEAALFQGPRVPFAFRWLDQRMVVTRAFGGVPLPRGAEILALDGVPARRILATLLTIARADGGNDARRTSLLEVTGMSRYEEFDVHYPLFFAMRSDSITLTLRRPGSRSRETVAVALMSFAAREQEAAALRPGRTTGDQPFWTFTWADERTAVLRMPTWVTYNSKWDWKGWLAERFDELRARRDAVLVVDLRGNEGGTGEVGAVLLANVIAAPLRVETMDSRLRYRKVPDRLLPYLDTWDPKFKDWGNTVMEAADGFYRRMSTAAADDVIEPLAEPFRGEVFALVDASNSSATFHFAKLAQRSGRVTLVGQPTGGNLNGINGSAYFFLRLPNSGLEVDIPLVASFPTEPRPDRGVLPDVPVRPTAGAIARGVDQEMEAVRAWLKAKKPRS